MLVHNKKGMTLATAVILILFASAVAISTAVFIGQRSSQQAVEAVFSKVIYLAQAGVNYAIYQYRNSATLFSGTVNLDANNYAVVSTTGGGGGGASSSIIIDATATTLTNSNRRVSNWTVRNNSASAVTINQATITWQKTPKTLTSLVINGVTVGSGNRTTPPAVYTVNFSIPANTTRTNNQVIFNSSAAGDAGITISFRMSDGTTTTPCTLYPAQASVCTQPAGALTIRSMGRTTGSNIYRTINASYTASTWKVTSCSETNATVP